MSSFEKPLMEVGHGVVANVTAFQIEKVGTSARVVLTVEHPFLSTNGFLTPRAARALALQLLNSAERAEGQ